MNRMKNYSISALTCLALGLAGLSHAQDDGSRAYLPAPANTRVIGAFGISIRGNKSADPATVIPGSKLKLDLGVLQYAWSFDANKRSSLGFLALPFGSVKGTVELPGGDASMSGSGIGDLLLGASFGLSGPPLLGVEDFVAYKPRFTSSAVIKVSAPTGQYDSDSAVNVGANRWMFSAGIPLVWYQGNSFIDPKLLTFELMPSVSFFTRNGSPLGGSASSQDPLYRIEGHITQNLNAKTLVSLDGLYTFGGATRLDGKRTAGSMRSLALGGTIGYTINPKTSIRLTYGQAVDHNDVGMDAHMWRVFVVYSF